MLYLENQLFTKNSKRLLIQRCCTMQQTVVLKRHVTLASILLDQPLLVEKAEKVSLGIEQASLIWQYPRERTSSFSKNFVYYWTLRFLSACISFSSSYKVWNVGKLRKSRSVMNSDLGLCSKTEEISNPQTIYAIRNNTPCPVIVTETLEGTDVQVWRRFD